MYVKLTVNKLYYIRADNDLEEFLTSVDILLQIIEAADMQHVIVCQPLL